MRDCAQGAPAKVWDIIVSMDSQINARTVIKYDIENIILMAHNVYIDANIHSKNNKKTVIQLCTQYNANPYKLAEYATE